MSTTKDDSIRPYLSHVHRPTADRDGGNQLQLARKFENGNSKIECDHGEVVIGNFGRFAAAWQCRTDSWITLLGENLTRSTKNSRAVLIEVSTHIEDYPATEYSAFHQLLGQFAFAVCGVESVLFREVAIVERHDKGWFARILYDVPAGMSRRNILAALEETWPCPFRFLFPPTLSWKTEARNQLFRVNLAHWDHLVLSRDYEKPDGELNRILGR